MFRGQLTATFQGCVCREFPLWVPGCTPSPLCDFQLGEPQVSWLPILKATVSMIETLSGGSSLRIHIQKATFPRRGRGGDFCWETLRAHPWLLLHWMGRVRCEENEEEHHSTCSVSCWQSCFLLGSRNFLNAGESGRGWSHCSLCPLFPTGLTLPGSPLPCHSAVPGLSPNQTWNSLRWGLVFLTVVSSGPRKVAGMWNVSTNVYRMKLSVIER